METSLADHVARPRLTPRVLHVVATGTRRGAELFAADLVASLGRQGVRQHVVVLHGDGGLQVGFEAPVTALRDGGLRLPGVRLDVARRAALRRLLANERFDVVQAHGGEALKYVVFSGGSAARLVHRSIGTTHPAITVGARRRVYSALMRRPAITVAVAEAVRRELVDVFGLSNTSVVTIPNGVDPGRLRPSTPRGHVRRALGIGPSARVIISIGTLRWEKDPLGALAVASGVLERRPEACYVVVGEGPLRPQMEEWISRSPNRNRIRLIGRVDDVGSYLEASDVVLFASRSDGMEGMPASLIEAGIGARPVVGYDIAGAGEVIDAGSTGVLVPAGDAVALEEALLSLVGDPVRSERMGADARVRCLARFDINEISTRYLTVYESLVRS